MNIRSALLCGLASVIILGHESAWAQAAAIPAADSAPSAEQSQSGARSQLEEIVVTAQRRQQRLQDVPIAVAAVSSDSLASKGVSGITGLAASVPGLQIATTGASSTIYLRGVGENGGTPNNEASVATYIDGVYIAAPNSTLNAFNNIERIEVLKGPQGTLFGRNATGGVVQIITKDPSQTPGGIFTVGYANYDTISGSFYGTAPLSSDLAIDFAFQYRNQMDGFGRNLTLNSETNRSDNFGLRSKLLWTPGDRTEIRVTGDYNEGFSSRPDLVLPTNVTGFDGVPGTGNFDTRGDVATSTSRKNGGGSVRIDHDFDIFRVTSISSYRAARNTYLSDFDATPLNIVAGDLPSRQHNVTQEFQIASPKGSAIDWLVGAFYYNNTVHWGGRVSGLAYAPATALTIATRQRTTSYAAYAQATATLIDKLKLTAGIRYTSERQKFDGTFRPDVGAPTITLPSDKQGYDKPTWRVALDYGFTDQVHGYVSYNRGVKSGGYNLLAFNSYDPETLDAFEAGLKSELFDRRLRLNLAAFQYNYNDIQIQTIDNSVAFFSNAAKARIRGVEGDFQAIPVENLTLNGGFSFLWGKYLSYPNAPQYSGSGPSLLPQRIDASGNDTVFTPKFTGNIGFNYTLPTDIGSFTLTSDLSYNDGYWFGPDQHFRNPSYYLLSASFGWTSSNERVGLRVWGANLANEAYFEQGNPGFLGNLAVRADPRTYGVTGTLKF